MRKDVAEDTYQVHMIFTGFYKRQDLRRYQQMKLKQDLPTIFLLELLGYSWTCSPRISPIRFFLDSCIVTLKLDRAAVAVCLQDRTETVANLDRLSVLKGQPQVGWNKKFVIKKGRKRF
jgi:hypothetical protein